VRQKKKTMFKTITSAKALSVARESVEQRGERAQQGQHLRLDARVVLDELRSSSCRPPLNFSCVFSRGVRRRVHGRSAASACAACAAVSGGQRRRRRVGSGRREARGASAGGCGKCCEEVVFGVCGSLNPASCGNDVKTYVHKLKATTQRVSVALRRTTSCALMEMERRA